VTFVEEWRKKPFAEGLMDKGLNSIREAYELLIWSKLKDDKNDEQQASQPAPSNSVKTVGFLRRMFSSDESSKNNQNRSFQ
jgi:hypothetical protein